MKRDMTDTEADAVLVVLAEDAFEVLNWARRMGFKRERQTAELVSAYKKTLCDTKTRLESLT